MVGLRPGEVDSECGDWWGRVVLGSVGHPHLGVQCNMHTMDFPLRRVGAELEHICGIGLVGKGGGIAGG